MHPIIPIVGAAVGGWWLFLRRGAPLKPPPAIVPVPAIVPLAPGTLPNYGVAGAAATAAYNLANYLGAKGCDSSQELETLVKSFQLSHNQDPKGNGPASALMNMTGQIPTTGAYDAITAFSLGLYTNGQDPVYAPCATDEAALYHNLNSAAQALYTHFTQSPCTQSPTQIDFDFENAWNAVGLPKLTVDGKYGKDNQMALTNTISAMLNPSTMTAPQSCF